MPTMLKEILPTNSDRPFDSDWPMAADEERGGGGDGCAGQAPAEACDEQRVKHNVRQAAGDAGGRAQLGPPCRHAERLQRQLQHVHRQGGREDAAVNHREADHFAFGAQRHRHRPHHREEHRRDNHARDESQADEHRERMVAALGVAFSEGLGHQRAAAGADHQPKG